MRWRSDRKIAVFLDGAKDGGFETAERKVETVDFWHRKLIGFFVAFERGYYGYGPAGYGTLGGFSRNFYGMPSYSPYDICNFGDRIGATVRYNFNNNMSIEVSVENRWLPSR